MPRNQDKKNRLSKRRNMNPSVYRRKPNRPRNDKLIIMREPGRYMPTRFVCTLRYTDTSPSRGPPVSSPFQNWRYRSSAFDPDPILGTGAIPGYQELANFYQYYVVTKMKLHVTINNQETSGILIGMWPSTIDHGNNTLSGGAILEYSGNPGGKSGAMGSVTGQSRYSNTIIASLTRLFSMYGKTDLDFAAPVGSNPTIPYFINIGLVQPNSNFTFITVVRVVIDYHITFFGNEPLVV